MMCERSEHRAPVAPALIFCLLLSFCGTGWARALEADPTAISPAAEAPTDSDRSSAAEATVDEIADPRKLFELYGIDASHFAKFTDGHPWQEQEDEILMKIFYRLPNLRPADLERWARPLHPVKLAEEPDTHRGQVYRIEGRAVSVDVERPLPEMAERLGLDRYYRVELELPQGHRADVFARDIPDAWTRSAELDEQAEALGFFLKVAGQTNQAAAPVFVAPRVAWYPNTLLGSLGMDVGLLDDVWQEEISGGPDGTGKKIDVRKLRLTGSDREAFYHMLAAVGRAEPGQLLREAQHRLAATGRKSYSVVPLFNQPKTQLGQLVVLSGNARRIIPVRVSDEDIAARLGIQRYYEIHLFTDDSQGNPLVFCVRRLPLGLPTGEGAGFGEYVTIAGFFFKTWAFQRSGQDSPGKVQWQLAPLLIGREPIWTPQELVVENPTYGLIAGGLLFAAILGLAVLVWLYGRSDRNARRRTIEKQLAPESGVSLDQLDLKTHDGPDFSGLGEADSRRQSPRDGGGKGTE
jgi:hypothetical protein